MLRKQSAHQSRLGQTTPGVWHACDAKGKSKKTSDSAMTSSSAALLCKQSHPGFGRESRGTVSSIFDEHVNKVVIF